MNARIHFHDNTRMPRRKEDPRMKEYLPLCKVIAQSYFRSVLARDFGFEDLQAVAHEALWYAVEKFDPTRGMHFGSWARKCINHALLHQKERAKRRISAMSLTTGDGEILDLESPIPSADDMLRESEHAAAVHAAMATLPERSQALLTRVFWWEQTLADVGREFGFSRERARQIQNEAFDEMRPQLIAFQITKRSA